VRRLFSRLWARTRALWDRARREHSTPREVGWSVAVGVFSGCTPFLGLHMWIALGLATILRLNRLWAFLGSRVSTNVLYVWIVFAEIELAHRLRFGAWPALAPSEALDHGRQLFFDWLVGTPLVGLPLAAALGAIAYVVARRWPARDLAPLTPLTSRTPAELRPPSSGSRPSAPPARPS
jgi:hypothetical protein